MPSNQEIILEILREKPVSARGSQAKTVREFITFAFALANMTSPEEASAETDRILARISMEIDYALSEKE